jgi:hypothetical protein
VEHGIEPRGATVEFLRPIGLGVECECGRRAGPTMLRAGCEECRVPTVPVRGWTRVLSLEALRDEAGTSAASMGLPAPELMLLAGESGRRATIGTESGGG